MAEPSISPIATFVSLPIKIHLLISSYLDHATTHAYRLTHRRLYSSIAELPLTTMPPYDTNCYRSTCVWEPQRSEGERFALNQVHYVTGLKWFGIYREYRLCQACVHLVHRKYMAKNIKDDAAVVCGRCITNVDFLFTKLIMNGRSFTLKGVDRLFCYDSACRNLSESTAQTQDWNAHLKLCEGCRVWPSKRVRSRLENYYEDDPFFEGCKSSDVLNNDMDEPEYDNNELERRIERPRPIKLRRIAEERLRAILET